MIKKEIIITSKIGLHARPATQVVNLAKGFDSNVEISKNGNKASAKSMIGLLGLSIEYNDRIELTVDGTDEDHATEKMFELLSSAF